MTHRRRPNPALDLLVALLSIPAGVAMIFLLSWLIDFLVRAFWLLRQI